MTGPWRIRRTTVITIIAVVSVLAAAVGILIALDEDHEARSVLRPSDLTGLGVNWQHAAPVDCSMSGCLAEGLVLGTRAAQLDAVDLSFASTVFRGSFERTYRSDVVAGAIDGAAHSNAMFGPGWMSVFDSRLVIGAASAGLVTPPTADRVVAVGRLDGTVSALWGSGELWQFDGRGRIIRGQVPGAISPYRFRALGRLLESDMAARPRLRHSAAFLLKGAPTPSPPSPIRSRDAGGAGLMIDRGAVGGGFGIGRSAERFRC